MLRQSRPYAGNEEGRIPASRGREGSYQAHPSDHVSVQDQYGVSYVRYWLNEPRGKVFCRCSAPNAEAAQQVASRQGTPAFAGGSKRRSVYDYVDAQVPMCARMYEKRQRGYRALGYREQDEQG
jgi:hypothetical protein